MVAALATAKASVKAIATRLLTIGAHIIGPNRPRALSTWPVTVNTP